jgi:hypothetical protein
MPERRHDLPGRPAQSYRFAETPGNFADHPKERVDSFSEILSGVRLSGAVFFSAEFSAPWGFTQPASNIMAARLAPGAEHLLLYHLVVEGGAVIELADAEPVELLSGDIVVFPHGHAHHMSSGKGTPRPFPNYGIGGKIQARDLSPLHAG